MKKLSALLIIVLLSATSAFAFEMHDYIECTDADEKFNVRSSFRVDVVNKTITVTLEKELNTPNHSIQTISGPYLNIPLKDGTSLVSMSDNLTVDQQLKSGIVSQSELRGASTYLPSNFETLPVDLKTFKMNYFYKYKGKDWFWGGPKYSRIPDCRAGKNPASE